MQAFEFAGLLSINDVATGPNFAKFPVKFPVSREFGRGDRFAVDCIVSHAVRGKKRIFVMAITS